MGKLLDRIKSGTINYNGSTYYNAYGSIIHKFIIALPLLLVNTIAFTGQMAWARSNLQEWGLFGQIVFATGLESIAIFLAFQAFQCEKRNDSALRLKLASYSFGLFVAAINYSHFAHNWKPNAVAIVVGMMSASSPFLWGIHSRSVARSILFQRNLIDEHMLRMGNRWIWHPIRSFKVMYWASWEGVNVPSKAISGWNEMEVEKAKEKALKEISESASMNGKGRTLDVESLNN